MDKMSEINLSGLFDSPDLWVKSIDWETLDVSIVPMTSDTYRQSNFLDKRLTKAGSEVIIHLEELLKEFRHQKPDIRPVNYIFHTAFCGSTLLSRCLEESGNFMSYREPLLLHQLAFALRKGTSPFNKSELEEFVHLLAALFGRTYNSGTLPIVKPSDSCINVAGEMLKRHPDAAALLLYVPLSEFVVTMLKIPSRRKFIRSMLFRARMDLKTHGIEIDKEEKLNDAEVATVVWLGLILPFLTLLNDETLRVRSLNSSIFYKSPEQTLKAVSEWLGRPANQKVCSDIVNHGAFTRQAKNTSNTFDRERKSAERLAYQEALAPEIAKARSFLEQLALSQSIPEVLPGTLMNEVDIYQ